MRKRILTIFLVLCLSFIFVSCNKDKRKGKEDKPDNPPEPIFEISQENINVKVGETFTFNVIGNGKSFTESDVEISFSDDSYLLETEEDITFIAYKVGSIKANIKVFDATCSCDINISSSSLVINYTEPESHDLLVGDTCQISCDYEDKDNITYTSSNPGILSVESGNVKALGVGNATITIEVKYFAETFTKKFDFSISAPVYKIDYVLDNGKLEDGAPTSYTEGVACKLLSCSKEGYTFLGWTYTKSSTGYITEIPSTKKGNLILYAHFKANSYNIIYELDGGTLDKEIKTYTYGQGLNSLPNVTKDGYVFKGFSTDKEGTKMITSISRSQMGDITLYANYELYVAKVEYDLGGGSFSWTTGTVSSPANGISSVSNLGDILMSDFYFYLQKNNLLDADTVYENLRVNSYADFSKKMDDPVALYNNNSTGGYKTVDGYNQFFYDSISNYEAVGGFFGSDLFKKKYQNLFKMLVEMTEIKYTSITSLDNSFKQGMAFVLDGYLYGTQGLLSGNDKFNKYRATIPTPHKDASGAETTYEEYILEDYICLVTPSRSGYGFIGWYDNPEFTGDVINNVTTPIKLYARWQDLNYKKPTYNITYEVDGGLMPSLYNEKYEEDSEYVLPIPTKDSHIFKGWSLEKGSLSYITKIDAGLNKDITVYANWEYVDDGSKIITYVYEEGNLPELAITDWDRFMEVFWNEFYIWSGSKSTLDQFKASNLDKWKGGAAGTSKVYLQDGKGIVDESCFVNAKANFDRWQPFLDAFDAVVNNVNGSQHAWSSTYVGYLRLYAFFTSSSSYVTDARKEMIMESVKDHQELINKYTPGTNVTLVGLVIDDGRNFLGWYDEDGNQVTSTLGLSNNITLYAKWSEGIKLEGFDVTNKIDKILKFDTYDLKYSFNPSNATNKKVTFKSSNPKVLSIDEVGHMEALKEGTVTITVTPKGNEDLAVSFEVTVYIEPFIDLSFATTNVVEPENVIKLNASLKGLASGTIKYTSLNPDILTIDDNGNVTGVKEGYGEIKAYVEGNEDINITCGITVIPYVESEFFEIIAGAHNPEVFVTRDLHVAYAYYTDVFVSANDLLFNYDYKINRSYEATAEATHYYGGLKASTEFICVHYTAGTSAASDGKANASYLSTTKSASIHYTTGNDGIYHCVDDSYAAYHAGDGGSTNTFKWIDTGVAATSNTKPTWGCIADKSSSTGYYFTVNGKATTISVPMTGTTSSGASKTLVDPASKFTFFGPAWKVENGRYYMGTTWVCFTQVAEGRISSKGGNYNSIGIETACNKGSDLWLTYQITAQLVARLMDTYNLDLSRVVGHNAFSGKDCPQTLLANNGELWYKFMECVEAEYNLYEQMTKNGKYTITCKSNNPDILADNGRIIKVPNYTTTVSYTVTVKDNDTGVTKQATFETIVHGAYVK